MSAGNGYPHAEHRFRVPSAIKYGGRFSSGTVEPLTDSFLFCFVLATLSVLFSNLVHMVTSFLNPFVHFSEWAQGLLVFHALILRSEHPLECLPAKGGSSLRDALLW